MTPEGSDKVMCLLAPSRKHLEIQVHSMIGNVQIHPGSGFSKALHRKWKINRRNQGKTKGVFQQKTLTEGGLEFKAANKSNQCIDFLNAFRKSPDVLGV